MSNTKIPTYDYLIAGGGIAGLYTAYNIIKHSPTTRICILEAANRLGGRLHSIHLEEGPVIEAGGARFNTQQHRILALIHELGLDSKKIEIPSSSRYIPIKRNYNPQLEIIFPEIDNIIQKLKKHIQQKKIPDSQLIKTNLLELIDNIYSHQYPTIKQYLTSRYPYYSELHSLNALEGLSLFTHEFSQKMRYFILAGGLEQLITKIHYQLKKYSNVHIHLNQPLETISCNDEKIYTTQSQDKQFHSNKIILALPQSTLAKIKYLSSKPAIRRLINSIQPEPLYRIYARYPIDAQTGKVWFADMPKVVSNLPIKYIIPSNVEKGIIMISYTDSKFARYWFNKLVAGEDILQKELARQLKLLFPELDIPKPLWIKHYYWDMGAGYWKPRHSRKAIMSLITKPLANQNIYICNENYSSHQAWVEGSLESADLVLEKIGISSSRKDKSKTKKKSMKLKTLHTGGATKKWRQYTLAEIAKHNKKTDAWIAIDGKVADITEWIPKHPGGNIIMKGVGKDATALFTNIGHDEYAKKMLKKYQIGLLAKSSDL
jgi:cytochrome b involved in lipid metabolism